MSRPEAHVASTTLLAESQQICSAWRPAHGHLVMSSPSHGLSWGCRAFCKPCCPPCWPPNGEGEAEGPRAVLPERLAERARASCHLCAAYIALSRGRRKSTGRSKLAHIVAVTGQSTQLNTTTEVLTGARRPEGTGLAAAVHAFSCALRDDISIVHSIAHLGITAFPLFGPTAVMPFELNSK